MLPRSGAARPTRQRLTTWEPGLPVCLVMVLDASVRECREDRQRDQPGMQIQMTLQHSRSCMMWGRREEAACEV